MALRMGNEGRGNVDEDKEYCGVCPSQTHTVVILAPFAEREPDSLSSGGVLDVLSTRRVFFEEGIMKGGLHSDEERFGLGKVVTCTRDDVVPRMLGFL